MNRQRSEIPVDEPLDPQVRQWLDSLRPTPPRDPRAIRRGREHYLVELEATSRPPGLISLTGMSALPETLPGRNHLHAGQVKPVLHGRPRRFTFTSLALILAVTLLFVGGATVSAAKEALPGDTFYGVKTQIEQTRLNLAREAGNRAQLMMDYAERRLSEIERLVQQGREEDLEAAVRQFEAAIQGAVAELQRVADGDPQRAAALADQISESLLHYTGTLSALADQAPDSIRQDLDSAIQAARETGLQTPGDLKNQTPELQATEEPSNGAGDDLDDQGALPTGESGTVLNDDENEVGNGDGSTSGSGDDQDDQGVLPTGESDEPANDGENETGNGEGSRGSGDDQDDQGALPTEESGNPVNDDESEAGGGDEGEAGGGDRENGSGEEPNNPVDGDQNEGGSGSGEKESP